MKFDALLEYQKTDTALVQIERELSRSDEKKNAADLDQKMRMARGNMAKFNAESDELAITAEKTAASIASYETEAEEIGKHIGEIGDMTEIEYYERTLASLAEDVAKLERELSKISSRLDYLKDGSDNLTRQTMQTNDQYRIAVQKFQNLKAALQEKGRPVNDKLRAMEKDIDPQLLTIYKRCRQNKKLPAFVEYNGDGSCFCGMNLPNNCVGKLKEDGDWVECPNCGRIVLVNK